MTNLSIIIVGSGIAGLSMAITLQRKGHDITVLEQHSSCRALGGPVTLSPSATRVLIDLGMRDVMAKRAIDVQSTNFRRYDTGEVLASSVIALTEEAYGFP